MPGGLFELRRDDITGWWVATVVEREYDRRRFAQRAEPVRPDGFCQNCDLAPGDGVWLRSLRQQAFTIAGSQREAEASTREEREPGQAGLGLLGDVGSWSTIAAPRGHHERLDLADRSMLVEMLAIAREQVRRARDTPGTS